MKAFFALNNLREAKNVYIVVNMTQHFKKKIKSTVSNCSQVLTGRKRASELVQEGICMWNLKDWL